MASLTIRNLDEPLKKRLRIQAAHNGRSMEEEVRQILRKVLELGLSQDAIEPQTVIPMRISPPLPAVPPAAVPLAIASVKPKEFDLRLAAAQDNVAAASSAETAVEAPSLAPERPAMAAPPLSVEAFTDGLRHRLALLVGLEADGGQRS